MMSFTLCVLSEQLQLVVVVMTSVMLQTFFFILQVHVSVFRQHYGTSVFDVMLCLSTVRGAGHSAAAGSTRCPHSGNRLQE